MMIPHGRDHREHEHEHRHRLEVFDATSHELRADAERGGGFVRRDGDEDVNDGFSRGLRAERDADERGVKRDARHEHERRSSLFQQTLLLTLFAIVLRVGLDGHRILGPVRVRVKEDAFDAKRQTKAQHAHHHGERVFIVRPDLRLGRALEGVR